MAEGLAGSAVVQPNRKPDFSRRELFTRLLQPLRAAAAPVTPRRLGASASASVSPPALTAVIAARDCLAFHGIACRVCHEHCPVPGAILLEEGFPRVMPDVCTGCGECHAVCPAPSNAVLMIPRRQDGPAG